MKTLLIAVSSAQPDELELRYRAKSWKLQFSGHCEKTKLIIVVIRETEAAAVKNDLRTVEYACGRKYFGDPVGDVKARLLIHGDEVSGGTSASIWVDEVASPVNVMASHRNMRIRTT